jgi:hypothetical protein
MRLAALALVVVCGAGVGLAQEQGKSASALTIYNQDFAVVRKPVALDLKAGTTEVKETGVTAQVEPDSVVLRDALGRRPIHVQEQNYDGALRVQAQMLAKFEGQTVQFVVPTASGEPKIISGRIVRAGTVPQFDLLERYGQNYFYRSQQMEGQQEPLIEVEGKLRYGLPGTPLFPADAQGLTLRPTLRWLIASDKPAKFTAELDYITKGLRWDASYNVVSPEQDGPGGQKVEMVGWVNVTNESGTDFNDVSVQLMAGDISKLLNANAAYPMGGPMAMNGLVGGIIDAFGQERQITQKSFDEYHLYDLHRNVSLRDHENKQVEFLNAAEIPAQRVYVYDGFKVDVQNGRYLQWNQENMGGSINKKVWVMQEFKNSDANHLGMPLPKGRMRFYRRDANGSLQFTGENIIDHTAKDEMVHVYVGNAFDLTGERTRTDFKRREGQNRQNQPERTIIESFKIEVRNAKDSAAPVRVVEHLYRTAQWEITAKSDDFTKKDSQTIEFNMDVPAHGEKDVTYTVTYTW